ncbi:hypothetical protein VOLCADRAFT_85206 [Volvox carteri f. nagariensis]|uniref:Flagellar associated protein n=1 Tax=Volvox carteri f. nagariensis TaxID=3068 RepID=D8TJS7_VOLCA|nr:uncharacterized protein VOLCADRAFT_85206 [Volvox carteri f. nagariensis]EFJ52595.1 hypothetical protein VOLCADRAFT_85206 [Volvox carteri f. nagariensis]|eukprot:XP_002946668.1 hypothetical protein VOLCADRAFT_85206 [Volvox carteri f. nagariensis]
MADALKEAFIAFASYGKGQEIKQDMDNKNFSKCMKDSKIIDGKCITNTEVDITFMKVKAKTDRTINYAQFCAALDHFAQKKGCTQAELAQKVAEASPTSNATKAQAVKYYDDKSMFTGVHKNGGPTTVDKMRAGGLANLCDRSPADNRGVKY